MKIAIVGTGAWGTALAQLLVDNGHEVLMYGISNIEVNDINNGHNPTFFGEYRLDQKIRATMNLEEALYNAKVVLLAVPSAFLRDACLEVNKHLKEKTIIVNVAKGLDTISNDRLSSVIKSILDTEKIEAVVSLIGPSFAEEVLKRMYTSICAVSLNHQAALQVQKIFSNNYMRIYTLNDEIGAEYGASIKNVIALASGMVAGLGLGDNTKAALITRGLAEISRFGIAKGGKLQTYLGLTGIGDLVLTCSSTTSRNFQAGYQIGKENSAQTFMKMNTKTVEGVRTSSVIYHDAINMGIEMPINNAVYQVLYNSKKPSEVIEELMNRSLKHEH